MWRNGRRNGLKIHCVPFEQLTPLGAGANIGDTKRSSWTVITSIVSQRHARPRARAWKESGESLTGVSRRCQHLAKGARSCRLVETRCNEFESISSGQPEWPSYSLTIHTFLKRVPYLPSDRRFPA